ncbi:MULTISPECIES: TetR/AcrR family transcriptional regulator [unclassified Aureimonas]|uniref:TetR/AcrR family transcriptional regulator n=1 Tax=unclassified Aureimonas TaxID=2615206 RepID=UPI00071F284F|nr:MULTISPECIES: TetR/AcrR family transcriptional regulator [unclassified Aureimonas]ALN72297.1 hypothetical protein M673_06195 [Aureimonas sp. AU20]
MSLAAHNSPSQADGRCPAGEDPAKRRQILEGARRAFVRMGFDAASMNDVTRESGVSKSTLYVYFRSKEELFAALIDEERDRYFSEVEALLVDPLQPADTLTRFGKRLAKLVMSAEAMHAKRTVIAVAGRMPQLGRDFYTHGPKRGLALLTAYLDKACEAGTLRIADRELAASQFIELSTAGHLRRRFFDDQVPEPTEEEIRVTVESAVWLFMTGYGVEA